MPSQGQGAVLLELAHLPLGELTDRGDGSAGLFPQLWVIKHVRTFVAFVGQEFPFVVLGIELSALCIMLSKHSTSELHLQLQFPCLIIGLWREQSFSLKFLD